MQRAADEGSDETQILSAREKETQPTPEIRTQYLQTCGITAGKEPTTAKSFWRIKLLKSRIFEGLELSPDWERNLKQVIISQVKFFQLNTTDGVLKPELIWELTWVEQRQEEVPVCMGLFSEYQCKVFFVWLCIFCGTEDMAPLSSCSLNAEKLFLLIALWNWFVVFLFCLFVGVF